MWRMKLQKSIELYRDGQQKPWRISQICRADGQGLIELTGPAADTICVQLKTLTRADFQAVVDLLQAAVRPDRTRK